jgi:hypothetical protein
LASMSAEKDGGVGCRVMAVSGCAMACLSQLLDAWSVPLASTKLGTHRYWREFCFVLVRKVVFCYFCTNIKHL